MKKPRVSFMCGAIMFLLIAVGYLLGYGSYVECTQKLNNLELQNQFISAKHLSLQKSLIILNSSLKDLKTATRRERKKILSKIEGITGEIQNITGEIQNITGEIQNWRNEYNTFLDRIKEDINNLANVDLGKVEVEKKGE